MRRHLKEAGACEPGRLRGGVRARCCLSTTQVRGAASGMGSDRQSFVTACGQASLRGHAGVFAWGQTPQPAHCPWPYNSSSRKPPESSFKTNSVLMHTPYHGKQVVTVRPLLICLMSPPHPCYGGFHLLHEHSKLHPSNQLYTLLLRRIRSVSLHSFLAHFIHVSAEVAYTASSVTTWNSPTSSCQCQYLLCFIFLIKCITWCNIMYLFANILWSVSSDY